MLLRSDVKAKHFEGMGCEVVIGDFSNKASLKTALTGVNSVFLVTAAGPDSHKQVESFLDVAKDFPSARIVRLSALKANMQGPTENTKLHGQSDHALMRGPNAWAVLQPQYFMQNALMSGASIISDGKMFMGWADGKVGAIDVRDVADCAVACLTDARWDYGCYTLTGPAALSAGEMAQTLGQTLGKEVLHVAITPAAVEKSCLDMGMNTWMVSLMGQYSTAFSSNWGNFTNGLVEQMSGHAPRSFATFAKEVFLPATQK